MHYFPSISFDIFPLNSTWQLSSSISLLFSTIFVMFVNRILKTNPGYLRIFSSGLLIGAYSLHTFRGRPIACQTIPQADSRTIRIGSNEGHRPIPVNQRAHKLDYNQLSTGSFLGLLLGYVTGKLSKLLCFLAVTGLLTAQFLQSRGIINLSETPVSQRISSFAREKLHIKEFLMDKPSFKLSFMSSFIIAALYA